MFGLNLPIARPTWTARKPRQPDSDRTPFVRSADPATLGKLGPKLGDLQVLFLTYEQFCDYKRDLLPGQFIDGNREAVARGHIGAWMVWDGYLLVPTHWRQDQYECNRAHACLCRVNGVPEDRRATCSYRKP